MWLRRRKLWLCQRVHAVGLVEWVWISEWGRCWRAKWILCRCRLADWTSESIYLLLWLWLRCRLDWSLWNDSARQCSVDDLNYCCWERLRRVDLASVIHVLDVDAVRMLVLSLQDVCHCRFWVLLRSFVLLHGFLSEFILLLGCQSLLALSAKLVVVQSHLLETPLSLFSSE